MIKQDLNVILLAAGYSVRHADWNWKGVHSPFARLYFVTDGMAQVAMQDEIYTLTPGHLYLIPAYVTHDCICDGDFSVYYFHIYDEQNIFDRLHFPFEVNVGSVEETLVKRLLDINPESALKMPDPETYDNPPTFFQTIANHTLSPFNTLVETKGIILLLLSKFLRQATVKNEITDTRIIKIIHHIRDNIEKNITVDELAEFCNLNKDHFIRVFKKELKCTPGQYINRKRIEKVQLLLVVEKKTIQEIAYSFSFANIPHFYTLFKAYTGMTPHQYRMKSK
jgi:AraC-like DNA-binding protein/mannose-6-phosphate isomerase-like protein (cupin superfamily)